MAIPATIRPHNLEWHDRPATGPDCELRVHATGKTVQLRFAEVFEMRDGKIKTMRTYWDTDTLMRQLGLI